MTTNRNFDQFIKVAAAHFDNSGIEFIPQDLPVNYFPIRFEPYLRHDAIYDTMEDFGLEYNPSSGIRLMAFHALKFAIEDCEARERQRIMLSRRLNEPIH